MLGPPQKRRSGDSNAPQIPSRVYSTEKGFLAGDFLGAISYGIVIVLFFQCVGALIDPTSNIKRGVKRGLITHTAALFMFVTIPIGINLHNAPADFIDNRNFPGIQNLPPGPVGYDAKLNYSPSTIVYSVMFPLNQWLADGLLLYRCYVIYSMNHWAMVFPCLIYLASIATGIALLYIQFRPIAHWVVLVDFGTAYYSICLSLVLLLTLMIVARLILHSRNIRNAMGTSDETTGLYTTILSMVVESYALYAASFIMYIVPWALSSRPVVIFRFLGTVQVIAPYLIILRVAKRRALTSEMITSGSKNIGSLQFRSQGTTDGDGFPPDGDPTSSAWANGEASDQVAAGTEHSIERVSF